MIDLKTINDNILSRRWKQKYEAQPVDIREKLDKLNDARIEEYQLQVIKRKRIYPEIGDVFQVNPNDDMILYGVVINNHINNINGDDLLLVLIFKENVDIQKALDRGIEEEDLLIPPGMVTRTYWTRGYFYNVAHVDNAINVKGYGFYHIGKRKFLDEYGKELIEEPELLGTYGVATLSGVAHKINQELIIAGIL